jgi:hypothetical protein
MWPAKQAGRHASVERRQRLTERSSKRHEINDNEACIPRDLGDSDPWRGSRSFGCPVHTHGIGFEAPPERNATTRMNEMCRVLTRSVVAVAAVAVVSLSTVPGSAATGSAFSASQKPPGSP